MEVPWVLVFGLGISQEGCHTIFRNIQRWSFVFSRISKGKVKNLKVTGFFLKKLCPQHPPSPPPTTTCLGFPGIAHWQQCYIKFSFLACLSSLSTFSSHFTFLCVCVFFYFLCFLFVLFSTSVFYCSDSLDTFLFLCVDFLLCMCLLFA